jgi:hypothetical protein
VTGLPTVFERHAERKPHSTVKRSRNKANTKGLESALVGDARIRSKSFRRKAPILALIEAQKRSGR